MIELSNIVKSFLVGNSEATILKGINLSIQKQDFVSIMGPSGSGKTTLAAILGCLSSPTSGSYKLDGTEVSSIKPSDLARFRNERIGFVFQDFNLLDGVSAIENVALPLVYAGISAAKRKSLASEALERVGLGHRLYHKPKQLSGGQKQRVAIARAIVTNPSLLFADEPTGALDSVTTVEILELMQQLNNEGQTVVQVTHSESDAKFSKRVIRIDDGQVIKDELVTDFDSGRISDNEADMNSDRYRAIWNLVEVSRNVPPQAMKDLRELSKNTNGIVAKIAAAKALLSQNHQDGHSQLTRLYKRNDWRVRAEILRNLDFFNNDLAFGLLTLGIADDAGWIRYLALNQIAKLDFRTQKICIGDRLKPLVNDEDDRVRSSVVSLIRHWGTSEHSELLLDLLAKDSSGRVRANIVEVFLDDVLINKGLPFHPERIKFTLDDASHRVKTTAAVLLQNEFPLEAKGAIWSCLNSDKAVERSAAVWAVSFIKDKELVLAAFQEIMSMKMVPAVQKQMVRTFKTLEESGTLAIQDILGLVTGVQMDQASSAIGIDLEAS